MGKCVSGKGVSTVCVGHSSLPDILHTKCDTLVFSYVSP